MSNFTFFHNVFYPIRTLKSFNSHISVVVYSFFEFGTVSRSCIRGWAKKPVCVRYTNNYIHINHYERHKSLILIESHIDTGKLELSRKFFENLNPFTNTEYLRTHVKIVSFYTKSKYIYRKEIPSSLRYKRKTRREKKQ